MKHANIKVNSITFRDGTVLYTAGITSNNIEYKGQSVDIENLIDEIKLGGLEVEIEQKSIYERGQSLKKIDFNWRYKGDYIIKSQVISSVIGDIEIGVEKRNYTLKNVGIRNDIDFILRSESLIWSKESIYKIRFGSRIYFGTGEEIKELDSRVCEGFYGFKERLRGIKGKIHLLIPTRFIPLEHKLELYINDMLDTGFIKTERYITNIFNHRERYMEYKSIYTYSGGDASIEIRSDR